ncbi:hypothetical protein [Allorhizocola rhizosphaerae]|uniref:WXG100-like domain-containing protein n=1 Tax=Allorhizocola rhizosphaerae TaxID=1872709 RepID=UPI0013C30467|nr:hypothetical protein [Allorhizocola rhizosphaerae]
MPPDTALWHEVVAEQGLQAVWPMDSEETATKLQEAWQKVADAIGEGGFQVSQAAGVVASSWPDSAGDTTIDAVTAYFDRIKETALQLAWIGIHGLSYADAIVKAKTSVKETIAGWEDAYAAAGVPQFGKDTAYDQSLVVFHAAQQCFKIIDDAARDIQSTLVSQALDAQVRNDRGTLDATRQGGNVARLFDAISRGLDRWGILTPITGVKTADDIDNGESIGQAIASNWGGWAANIGTGTLVAGAIGGAAGGPIGMLAGMTAGAFTSGVVDSMYENGPTHLSTALDRGGEQVVETFQGIGEAVGSGVGGIVDTVGDLFDGDDPDDQ